MIDNPWFYAAAVPAVLITGLSKGGVGGGVGGFGVPIMSLVIAPPQAAAVMLPILCVMDVTGFRAFFGKWDGAMLRRIIPAGLVGILVGTFTFKHLNNDWIRVLLGVIALGFLAYNIIGKRGGGELRPLSNGHGFFWAGMSGFTSFVAHSGGPPLAVYMLVQRMDKTVYLSTSMAFFFTINYAKIVPYAWLGLLDLTNLTTSLVLIPVGIAGTYLGIWVSRRMSQKLFYRIAYAAFFCTGTKLMYDGVSGLLAAG